MISTYFLLKLLGILIRHGATALGGWLVMTGHLDAESAHQLIGVVLALAGVGASTYEKRDRLKPPELW